ncbi:MAG TPA: hypothetical protein VF257_13560 [Solirubrobacteraceae bacterium]
MSIAVIIAIVVVVVVAIALIALPRARARARERELARRRGEVADAHRDQASERVARAEEAEQIAARERAEAELHETRARLHEHGLADDELDAERDRLDDGPSRFDRDEHDTASPPDERPAPR